MAGRRQAGQWLLVARMGPLAGRLRGIGGQGARTAERARRGARLLRQSEADLNIQTATKAYETFLHEKVPVVEADLETKHKQMAAGVFPFLRSTFYRFSSLFREVCPDLAKGPELLAVGDLHVENFGTWRDSEGRLIWGINDVDEAQTMPYAIDLVRLATSALLAAEEAKLALPCEELSEAILTGYREWLEKGGRPYVLEEEHGWLRTLATGALRDPVVFAAKMDKLAEVKPPKEAKE